MGRSKGRRERREGGRRAGSPLALARKPSSQGLPTPGRRITKAPRCHANSRGEGGARGRRKGGEEERRLQDPPWRREVSFFAFVPSTPTRVPPSQLSAYFPLHPELRELVAQPRPTPPFSALLEAPQKGLKGKRPGSNPSNSLRSGLGQCASGGPASSRSLIPDPRDRGALLASHLLPIHLSVRGGEGGGDGGCLPAPTSRSGGADRSQRAQKAASAPLRPSAPNLPRQLPQLLLPPGLPGGATARHLD